jgi:hypothetical protein
VKNICLGYVLPISNKGLPYLFDHPLHLLLGPTLFSYVFGFYVFGFDYLRSSYVDHINWGSEWRRASTLFAPFLFVCVLIGTPAVHFKAWRNVFAATMKNKPSFVAGVWCAVQAPPLCVLISPLLRLLEHSVVVQQE